MAKTKEKIVDLKPKAEKVTEEELQKLQEIIRTIDRLTLDLGRMESQKFGFMKAMEVQNEAIEGVRKDFIASYGTDNVNIQTGEIAYTPENKENGEVDS